MNRCRYCDREAPKDYCDQQCRRAGWGKRRCLVCGDPVTQEDPALPLGVCSLECRTMWRSVTKLGRIMPQVPTAEALRSVIYTVVAQAAILEEPLEVEPRRWPEKALRDLIRPAGKSFIQGAKSA